MSAPTWLECVEVELLRRRLPRQEVARLVAELGEHLSDLIEARKPARHPTAGFPPCSGTGLSSPLLSPPLLSLKEEPMSMEANAFETLGSPVEIADTAIREFRQRKGRLARSRLAAFSTFVLLPVPLLIVAWIASLLAIQLSMILVEAGLGWGSGASAASTIQGENESERVDGPLEEMFGDLPQAQVLRIGNWLLFSILLVPAVGTAVFFGRIARRTPRPWLWGITACALVGLAFGATRFELRPWHLEGKDQISMLLGLHVPPPARMGQVLLRQFGLSLLPLAAGILVLRRSGESTLSPG